MASSGCCCPRVIANGTPDNLDDSKIEGDAKGHKETLAQRQRDDRTLRASSAPGSAAIACDLGRIVVERKRLGLNRMAIRPSARERWWRGIRRRFRRRRWCRSGRGFRCWRGFGHDCWRPNRGGLFTPLLTGGEGQRACGDDQHGPTRDPGTHRPGPSVDSTRWPVTLAIRPSKPIGCYPVGG